MSIINPWKPEEDVVLHQALGKLAEECSELAKIATRCMIQGYAEDDPVTHKLNRTQLMEEVADVRATMRWLFDVLDKPFKGESPREARKFDGFKRWEAILRATPAVPEPTLTAAKEIQLAAAHPTQEFDMLVTLEAHLKSLIAARPKKASLAALDDDTRMWFVAQLTGVASGSVPLTEIEAIVSRHLAQTSSTDPVTYGLDIKSAPLTGDSVQLLIVRHSDGHLIWIEHCHFFNGEWLCRPYAEPHGFKRVKEDGKPIGWRWHPSKEPSVARM